jgi:nicotinamidase-related amidase
MPKKKTLVIVDVQKAFTPPPAWVDAVRRYSRRFECRIFTRFVNPPGSIFRRKLKQRSCAPGSEDTALLIRPEPGDIILDKYGYGLRERDVAKLRSRGIRNVVVCGLDTDACVLGVMFSLFDGGIECRVKEKYCRSSTGLHHEALKVLKMQFLRPR